MAGLFLVELTLIDVDPENPRGEIDDVSDLKQSLQHNGQQDPIQVIVKGDGRYGLHEGHRRVQALTEIGETHAKAITRTFRSDLERRLSQGAMHAHRRDFDPMAWSRYLNRLFWDDKLTREQIAVQLGVSQGWVREHLSFVHLKPSEQADLQSGDMSRKEALSRLAARRAARDGRPDTTTTTVPGQPRTNSYFNGGHPLAEQVAIRCAAAGLTHAGSTKIGGMGCGRCWEDVIRADALTAARPALAAA